MVLSGCGTLGGNISNSSGMGYYEKGNYMAAANEFQSAVRRNPNNPDYMANLAKSKVKLGDAYGAEQLYRQALMVSPSHHPSYHVLSELMLDQGRDEEAAAMLTTWAATQPYVAESHVELAWLQRELDHPHEAAQSLQRALQVNPSHSTALAHLGQYYEESGQHQQAATLYQESLRADWDQPEVHSRLAGISQSVGSGNQMAATAMARGVNPYEMPRQQYAFGPPSPGVQRAQMAQMQAMQSQWAMNGQGAWPGMPPQMMNAQAMPGGYNSAMYAPTEWHMAGAPAMNAQAMPEFSSFGTSGAPMMMPQDGSWTVEGSQPGSTVFEGQPSGGARTATQPQPDPAFSMTPAPVPGGTPVSTASWSPTESTVPSPAPPSASATPVVDAF
jgi:Tfp pilus assembly protein PilF